MPGCRAGLLRDQHIRKTLEMARRASVLLVSVGAVTQASGIFRAGYLNETDLEYIRGQGAVGDICGVYFRQDGSPCSLELEERTIAAGGDAMRRTALRVGVGWGAAKALPSIGAIRAGLINTLVTDEECARAMLAITARRSRNLALPTGRRTPSSRPLNRLRPPSGELVNSVSRSMTPLIAGNRWT